MPIHITGHDGFSGHQRHLVFLLALFCATTVQASDREDTIIFHSVALSQYTAAELHHPGANGAPVKRAMPNNIANRSDTLLDFARFEEVTETDGDNLSHAQAEQLDKLTKRLDEETALHGPYDPALLDILNELADLHQSVGSHQTAISLLERSEQIIRINKGLHHLQQAEVVDRIIPSLQATGRTDEIENRLQSLLHLQQKAHGARHVNTVGARLRLGEWYLERFNQLSSRSPGKGNAGNPSFTNSEVQQNAAWERLTQAQEQFVDSINILTEAAAYRHPDLMTLEHHLLETYYLQAYHLDPGTDRHQLGDSTRQDLDSNTMRRAYRGGEHAHNRILAYLANDPDTTVTDYAKHLAGKGDWYMLFGDKSKAMDIYQQAEELLNRGDIPVDIASAILRPEVPVSVPASNLNPLNTGAREVGEYDGYVDVAFRVSRNGKARHIRTIGGSTGLDESVEHRLMQLVRDSRFRPHIQEGRAVDSNELQLRYYFTH